MFAVNLRHTRQREISLNMKITLQENQRKDKKPKERKKKRREKEEKRKEKKRKG